MMQIEINEEKCKSSRECRKCLQACPEGVFLSIARAGSAPDKRVVVPVFMSFCSGCKICEEVCPQKAVTLSIAA